MRFIIYFLYLKPVFLLFSGILQFFFYSFVHPTDVKLNFILPAFMSS